MKKWRIEWDNDTGPNDEGYTEWWIVTDGLTNFKCESSEDANFLLGLLEIHAS